jgi:hypothetical protein
MAPTIQPISTHLELNLPGIGDFSQHSLRPRAKTASVYFGELFPEAAKQYGCPFVEIREALNEYSSVVTPVSINLDFFAAALGGDARLGHSIIYYQPEMQWYYREPQLNIYKATTSEKLQSLYRGLLMRAARDLPAENNRLNLCMEFQNDRTAKAVIQRAKSILAADYSFFSATSPHQRIKGPELHERLMRVLCESMLQPSEGACLTVTAAFNVFCRLAQQRQLGTLKRSLFKATMADLMKEMYGISLRHDVPDALGKHQQAWKGVRLVEAETFAA